MTTPPTTTDAQAGAQVLFVSVPFEELDTGGAGVAVVVAPAALVKDVCAAAVADDAYFGVLNVPEQHQSHRKNINHIEKKG